MEDRQVDLTERQDNTLDVFAQKHNLSREEALAWIVKHELKLDVKPETVKPTRVLN